MFLSIDFSSLPWVEFDLHLHLQYVIIGAQIMATQDDGKLFGAVDTVFLSQKVNRVLLGISGDDVGIIP